MVIKARVKAVEALLCTSCSAVSDCLVNEFRNGSVLIIFFIIRPPQTEKR